MTRASLEKGKSPFHPVTTTVFPSDKVPASLSSNSIPSKPSPVTADYIYLRLVIVVPSIGNSGLMGQISLRSLQKRVLIYIRLAITVFQEQVQYLL